MTKMRSLFVLVMAVVVAGCQPGFEEVNVYSGRHYRSDEELFRKFTEETGIKVNLIKADTDQLINRMILEGESTRADLFVTADASRLSRAVEHGILQRINDQSLINQVPAGLRDPDGYWLGLTKRARVIVYNVNTVSPDELSTYEDLTTEKWHSRILVRSSQSHYNQSLLASLLASNGADAALQWAEGIVRNMAQQPRGNDRDQVKAIAAGIGDIALINTYYLGLLMRSANAEERNVASQVRLFFPNQENRGAHINVSGMGIAANARNTENALALIRFLLQKDSQEFLAGENFEYPVIAEAELPQLLNDWGPFKADTLSITSLGTYIEEAMLIFNKAGWQ
jgi:iron(III) transport system substrate-binding protein